MDNNAALEGWKTEGNCRSHPVDVFFPSDGIGVQEARKICGTCPVKTPCLEYALRHRIAHGVWGGTSERERRRTARHRRIERAVVANASGPGSVGQRAVG